MSPYAASKVAVDFLAVQAHLGWGLDVIRVRPFNHLGVGQSDRFVAPALARRIARNELSGGRLVPVGNLSTRRDFTDVRDVARAYRLVMESETRAPSTTSAAVGTSPSRRSPTSSSRWRPARCS